MEYRFLKIPMVIVLTYIYYIDTAAVFQKFRPSTAVIA